MSIATTPPQHECPKCGGPTNEWLTFCATCAPLYGENDNQGHLGMSIPEMINAGIEAMGLFSLSQVAERNK